MTLENMFNATTAKDAAYNAEFLAAMIRFAERDLLPDENGRTREQLIFLDPECGKRQPVPSAAIGKYVEELKAVEARERQKAQTLLASARRVLTEA